MAEQISPLKIGPHQVVRPIARQPYSHIYEVVDPSGEIKALKLGSNQYIRAEYDFLMNYPSAHFVRAEKGSCAEYAGEKIKGLRTYFDGELLGYFLMELLDGCTLKDCLKESELPANPVQVVNQMLAISQAMLPIWENGHFHGDINPNNIMCLWSGEWKLLDFHIGGIYRENLASKWTTYGTLPYLHRKEFSLLGCTPSFSRDLYSCALTIYESITSDLELFSYRSVTGLKRKKKSIRYRRFFNHVFIPPILQDFLLDVCASFRWHRITKPDMFIRRLMQVAEALNCPNP
jgi:serine/threonine protein kinase